MANRIVATFSGREVQSLGEERFRGLQEQLTPVLNVLAGCTVFWQPHEDGFMVLAPPRPDAEIVHDSDCALNNGPAMASRPCDCGADGSWQHGTRARFVPPPKYF